jgi:hypothetical protein
MKPIQYIGFTDPMTQWDTQRALAQVPPLMNIKLHVGVMTSRTKISGKPTAYDDVWLPIERISEPFVDDARVINILHYADFGKEDFYPTLRSAVQHSGALLDGIQLDMVWPNPSDVIHVLGKQKEKDPLLFILQVGRKAFEMIDHDPAKLLERLRTYGQSLTHVLFDLSMGEGKPMDASQFRPYIEATYARFPDVGQAVAGGLGPDTLELVEPLIADYSFLSIDAQGQLRDSGDSKQPLTIERVERYVKNAYQMYSLKHPFL